MGRRPDRPKRVAGGRERRRPRRGGGGRARRAAAPRAREGRRPAHRRRQQQPPARPRRRAGRGPPGRARAAARRRAARSARCWSSAGEDGRLDGPLADIVELADDLRVPVREVGPHQARRRRPAPRRPRASSPGPRRCPRPTSTTWRSRRSADGAPPFLVAVDGVTDPGNLGALLRSAECAGVTGVVLPRHRAVHVTPTVTKAAAGAVEHLPMALVGGLPAALERLKAAGLWVVGLDAGGDTRPARAPGRRRPGRPGARRRGRGAVPPGPPALRRRRRPSRCAAGWARSTSPPPPPSPPTRSPAAADLGPGPTRASRSISVFAGLAQLVEHLSCKQDVVGSIPTPGSPHRAAPTSGAAPSRSRGDRMGPWH